MRVVSLLPSATEIVYALGLEDDLVGVTFECNEPARARVDKTIVVDGHDTSGMTPAEIDAYVRSQVAAGSDLYHLRRDALATLRPDVVLTQDLCAVCALPGGTVPEALEHLGCSADVVTLDPHSLSDVLASIESVGERLGVPGRAHELVDSLRARLDAVAVAVSGRARPRVAVVEWVDPPFPAGHWVPDLVVAAGGEPVAAMPGARSRPVGWQEFADASPQIVVVAPCGFGLDAAAHQAETVCAHLPGPSVWAVDGDGLIVRPGPRLVDGVEALASVLHPGAVAPRPDAVRLVRP